ncbi:ATP-binding protein [Pararhizobium sp. IMCC21322]|uniref:ATP-binding protein n=1 Tax=Pararhizobium sp. IMCC21322 TaxID=3067903 RepID=UPI0027426345|nr:ATP-binding protein [Pararhizobium sp. IMCC21322]
MTETTSLPLTNPPDAARLIYGLRDTGYSFNTAAADVIDNSIAANAVEVHIKIAMNEDGRKVVTIGDNGDGMNEKNLFGAMKYGAQARQSLASLGKFGLGLKTASSSVCLRFTVISRDAADGSLAKLTWDLEHVQKADKWEMLQTEVSADEYDTFEEMCGERGTLVVWENCDRILSKEYANPGGAHEQAALNKLEHKLIEHASLIYYRFLDKNDGRERDVTITVNGTAVDAWNPFFTEKSDQVLETVAQKIEIVREDGTDGEATIKAWILPPRSLLTKEEEDRAKIANHRQGFYIHREGRLIQQGGWLGVFGTLEPHMSLLRVEFDFNHELDEAFKVDVKKSRIHFDPALEAHLKERLTPVRREAQNRYRRKNKEDTANNEINHSGSNNNIAGTQSTKKPGVTSVDVDGGTGIVSNNHGTGITIKSPVQNNVDPKSIHVEAVDDINSGELYEPTLRSTGNSGHVPAVRINKHHDFYQKIYQRAAGGGFAVQGMDLLLWAFAVAEQNNTNEDLDAVFEDLRDEVSGNLKKLLRNVEMPEADELDNGTDNEDDD